MDEEELDQGSLFGMPEDLELDDLLEQHVEAEDSRAEFEPTEEELIQDEAFLPGVHLEPLEELNEILVGAGLPPIQAMPGLPDGKILLVPNDAESPEDAVIIDWSEPEPDESDVQYDQRADQLRDEQADTAPQSGTVEYRVWMGYSADDPIVANEGDSWLCACGRHWLKAEMPVDDDLQLKFCGDCGLTGAETLAKIEQKRELLKDSPIPTDQVLSADELIAIANAALDKLETEKRAQKLDKYKERMSRGADLRHPVNTPDYVQARIIEGGCGEPDCPMCLGNTCRFCGYGCWDPKGSPTCNHDIQTRHIWDATKEEYRKNLIDAELTALGMTSEIRRLEMLAKIFEGEPNKGESADYCYKCNKPIGMGVLVVTTSRGRYHYDCPTDKTEVGTTPKQTDSHEA